MPSIEIYGFDLYSDTGIDDMDSSKNGLSFIGETFTFNGGSPTTISISDDDLIFEDGKTETDDDAELSDDVSINGDSYDAEDQVEMEFSVVDASGREVWIVRIDGENVGFAYLKGDAPVLGESFTTTLSRDGDGNPGGSNPGGVSSDVSYSSLACFTQGTNILTDKGEVLIEQLQPGDLVQTKDRGFQAIRWIGSRKVRAVGRFAPVVFAKGVVGNQRELTVSQQHRMLIQSVDAELHFGEFEVFTSAKSLLNGSSIRLKPGGFIDYFHILFDRHEIVFSEGTATESFHPGQKIWQGLYAEARDEILSLFPELKKNIQNYGSTARFCLKNHEVAMLGLNLAA